MSFGLFTQHSKSCAPKLPGTGNTLYSHFLQK